MHLRKIDNQPVSFSASLKIEREQINVENGVMIFQQNKYPSKRVREEIIISLVPNEDPQWHHIRDFKVFIGNPLHLRPLCSLNGDPKGFTWHPGVHSVKRVSSENLGVFN